MKILAIIYLSEVKGAPSYGYNIWRILKEKFYCYLEEGALRNVYRHLEDLNKLGLIDRGINQRVEKAPDRLLYSLTDKGRALKEGFEKYLKVL